MDINSAINVINGSNINPDEKKHLRKLVPNGTLVPGALDEIIEDYSIESISIYQYLILLYLILNFVLYIFVIIFDLLFLKMLN
jgi:hypothetical protein